LIAKLFGILVLVLTLSACGKFTLGESADDSISTAKSMGGCQLDKPIPLDNEDLLRGLTLRDVVLAVAPAHFSKDRIRLDLFEIHSDGRPLGYLGASMDNNVSSRGFANDYSGNVNFTGEKTKKNSAMLYRTEFRSGERLDAKLLVVVDNKAIQGIQLEFPKPPTYTDEATKNINDVACVKSATK